MTEHCAATPDLDCTPKTANCQSRRSRRQRTWLVYRLRIRYAHFGFAFSLQMMRETLVSLALVVGILGLSAVLTELFARKMYNRCPQCKTLNAKRRSQCRACGQPLP